MTKIIQKVWDVLEKARRNGEAKNFPYEAELTPKGIKLYHYNTLIYHCYEGRIVRLGGWSKSDADAIYTASQFCRIPIKEVSNKKIHAGHGHEVMNGWFIIR